MSTEEPAWKADMERDLVILGWLADNSGDLVAVMEPHIQAAEQRGREQALRAVDAEIEVFQGNIPQLKAGKSWKLGYAGALSLVRVTITSLGPDKRCERCKGSGIDPEHSYPAEGPSYYSMGEPEVLEPCIACQYPDKP